MKIKLTIFLVIITITHYVSAQTFTAYATAGGVVSQIDGDRLGGYNKVGVTAGIGLIHPLSDTWSASMELGYIQKGKGSFNESENSSYKTQLHYIHLPVMVQYQIIEELSIESGVSFAFLMDYKFYENGEENNFNTYTPNSFDLDWLLGTSYRLNNTWKLNIRFAYSIVAMGDLTPDDSYRSTFWKNPGGKYNRSISLSIQYHLN